MEYILNFKIRLQCRYYNKKEKGLLSYHLKYNIDSATN